MSEIKNKLTEQEFELEKLKVNNESDLKKAKTETIKWVIGAILGAIAAALTYSAASNANNIALLDSDRDHFIATELLTLEKNKDKNPPQLKVAQKG